jgi:colanic acid biosynthesis glycosyl transferase WcaI
LKNRSEDARAILVKVLLVNQFFWPDSAATSQILTEFARYLAEQGHEVFVICGPDGYAAPFAEGSPPPVEKIIRTPSLTFSRGVSARVLSYISFALWAIGYGFRVPRPDLVVTLTTPPLLSLVGTLLRTFRGSRHFIWEMDVYPDVAIDLGVLKRRSWLTRAIGKLADFARMKADGIIVLGECMRDRLIARGIPESKLHLAENWADGNLVQPVPPQNDGKLCVLYSGNLGLAHDVDTITGVMERLRNDDRFRFVFLGAGIRRKPLEEWCMERQLDSVQFFPYQSREHLSRSLGSGDIGLVTLLPACTGSVVPSKTYALMAAARPILFIGSRTAMPARIVERYACGWQIEAGDVEGLIALLGRLAENPGLVSEAGERARQAFLEHYDFPTSVSRLTRALGIVSGRGAHGHLLPKPAVSLEGES